MFNGTYNEIVYKEARMVAIHIHGNQTYDEIYPYVKHLDDVCEVLRRFGYSGKFIVAGFLHDALEDSALSYNKILKHFGKDVAEMVYCVTDEQGRDRKEKKEKTLPKTASNKDSIILKLADRIANIEHGGKVEMYRKEYEIFNKALYNHGHCDPMWKHLENLLKVETVSI